jgi:transcription initiation factor IIE alpha subunit|tara:strand:- start:484 stop:657 length:174 start_codon:yes stop_codon:yes gene_type:complete
MAQKRKTQCPHCEESFTIIWEEVDLEPWTCPFCGGALDKDDETETISSEEDDEDNWN